MTSTIAKPLCISPAFKSGTSWSLSPEKLLATNVAPNAIATWQGSIGTCLLASPFFAVEPTSADAENWPLVSPYTPLFSII